MVFCTYCGQSFTRDEHLERHILTHTNVKPFKCFTCHMSFARRDLLQRHYTVHGKDQTGLHEIPAANGMIPKSAGRTPIACSNCAKTKTKCDKKFPCSRCAGRNLKCTLRPTRRVSKSVARMGIPQEGAATVVPGVQPHEGATETSSQAAPPLPQPQSSPRAPPSKSPREKPSNPSTVMVNITETSEERPVMGGALPQYIGHPIGGPTPPSTFSPPMLSHVFLQDAPLDGVNDYSLGQDMIDENSSPHFMLDWSQMQIPMGYDGMIEPHLMMNGFDPTLFPLGPNGDGMLTMVPDVAEVAPLITPLETPKMERMVAELDLGSIAATFQASHRPSTTSTHSPQSLQSHQSSPLPADVNGEMPEIIQAQDAWSAFKCTPTVPSSACPKTAKRNLERLEDTLRNHEGWASWTPQWDEDMTSGDHLTVMQLHESTRDKLLAITQTFLHKALEIHRDGCNRSSDYGYQTPNSNAYYSNFVLLPPARVLEYFLRSYSNCFERYFPLTSKAILDANELMHCYNDRAASLLVLMMIAQGAMNIPSTDARMLTGGLTEACRISLFDLIERNIIMAGDPIVLHSALLFVVQAAWSGDKWQMDIAMGQRGMYLAMLRHSGILDKQIQSSTVKQTSSRDQLWNEWITNESRSRLIYSWIMVDQDLALFHDTAPLFSVTEFNAPMPDADRLWQANSASEWSSIFEQVHEFSGGYSSVGSGARPLSLRDLFRHFLDDDMIPMGIEMTPLQLRLLLHPLQSLVCQNSQLLSCFSETKTSSRNSAQPRAISSSTTRSRLEEIQSLLGRWYDLAERYLKANPICAVMQTNLIIFHLISLNAVTSFPEVERLARREDFDGTYQQLLWAHKRCIHDVEEAIFHCGQVFRIIRSMPRSIRPPWWAGAIYRVGLVLWTDSLTHKEQSSPKNNGMCPVPGPSFAIDALTADHPLIVRYLTKREGVPCVTKRDGSQMSLDRAFLVLQHCIEVIDEGAANRFSDGIRSKLEKLSRG